MRVITLNRSRRGKQVTFIGTTRVTGKSTLISISNNMALENKANDMTDILATLGFSYF